MQAEPKATEGWVVGVVTEFTTKRLTRCPGNQVEPTQSPGLLDQVDPLLDVEDLVNRQSRTCRHAGVTSGRIDTDHNTDPSRERHDG